MKCLIFRTFTSEERRFARACVHVVHVCVFSLGDRCSASAWAS